MKLYKLLVFDTDKRVILYTQSFFGSQTLLTYQDHLRILQSFFLQHNPLHPASPPSSHNSQLRTSWADQHL